jgi:hypothetical protein
LFVAIETNYETFKTFRGIIADANTRHDRSTHMGAVLERKASASQDRGALAKMVMTLLEHWKLTTEDQAALFGIATSNRADPHALSQGGPHWN